MNISTPNCVFSYLEACALVARGEVLVVFGRQLGGSGQCMLAQAAEALIFFSSRLNETPLLSCTSATSGREGGKICASSSRQNLESSPCY